MATDTRSVPSVATTALLVPMHQMKVCIVGASGKLGQYLVQHALDRGREVVVARYFATAVPVIVHVTKPIRHAPVASRWSNHAWVPVITAGPSSAGLSIIVRKLANL